MTVILGILYPVALFLTLAVYGLTAVTALPLTMAGLGVWSRVDEHAPAAMPYFIAVCVLALITGGLAQ